MLSLGSQSSHSQGKEKQTKKQCTKKKKREREWEADLNARSAFMPQQLITLIRLVTLAAVIRASVRPLTKNHSSQKSSIKCTEPLLTEINK